MANHKISLIIPTYNERDNIKPLTERLIRVLAQVDIPFEVIFVDDDSPDGTWREIQSLSVINPQIKLLRRIGRRGLSTAVVEGLLHADGDLFLVMDADLQHDEKILPKMIEQLSTHRIVIGSRHVEEGGISQNWGVFRRLISYGATRLTKVFLAAPVKDPMSGFFGLRKDVYLQIADRLNPQGFKILMEILYRSKEKSVAEVGYKFSERIHGKSKLSTLVVMDFLLSLFDLLAGDILPVRFVKYSLIGVLGVVVNLLSLYVFMNLFGLSNNFALPCAIFVSMVHNFLLNNFFTFPDYAFDSLKAWVHGFMKFLMVSLLGALINYSVALIMTEKLGVDIFYSDMLGIIVAMLWNYRMNVNITWKSS